jgi:hypothetical protein
VRHAVNMWLDENGAVGWLLAEPLELNI